MGAGFITGGYCPGTSVCGAAIGKIDAMAFIGGIFLGVLFFGEAYPLYENFYNTSPKGAVKLSDTLGFSDGVTVLLVMIIAIVAFIVTDRIENRVKKVDY